MITSYDNMMEEIAQAVFATMLNIELVRVEDPAPLDSDLLLATVHIAGEWTGSVVLGLSPEAASAAAGAMLQIAASNTSTVDQQEVATELANMIGGNLKSVLPGPSFLSLPTIVTGHDFGVQVRDAELVEDVTCACDQGLVRMRLYAKSI
jgi:chemotaxis protein CheX